MERRKTFRQIVELPLRYSILESKERWGIAADASEGGILAYLHEFVETESLLELLLFYPMGSTLDAVDVHVRVIWSQPAKDAFLGEYRCGLAFERFRNQSRDKFRNLLYQNAMTRG